MDFTHLDFYIERLIKHLKLELKLGATVISWTKHSFFLESRVCGSHVVQEHPIRDLLSS